MHDRSVFSARISVCISSVEREAAAFAPPVALSPAVPHGVGSLAPNPRSSSPFIVPSPPGLSSLAEAIAARNEESTACCSCWRWCSTARAKLRAGLEGILAVRLPACTRNHAHARERWTAADVSHEERGASRYKSTSHKSTSHFDIVDVLKQLQFRINNNNKVTEICDRDDRAMSARSRTGLASASALATASPARLLRACAPAHASTAHSARAQHACARLAGDAHALTRQHTLARQKLDVMLEALATGWPSAGRRLAHLARTRSANASPPPLLARPMRHPHALPALSTAVATVCSEIMITSEMETNETMQKTENTMQDARECARAARVCGSHSRKRTRERARRSQASEQSKTSFKNMCAGGR